MAAFGPVDSERVRGQLQLTVSQPPPLVLGSLYFRFKKAFGRQAFTPRRMLLRMALLSAFSVFFLFWVPTPAGFASAFGGACAGATLGVLGLRRTRFEHTSEGRFYTPHRWIALGVTGLFFGRLTMRMVTLYGRLGELSAAPTGDPMAGIQRSPLTVGIFFLLAAYYLIYYSGVLRTLRRAREAPVPPVPP